MRILMHLYGLFLVFSLVSLSVSATTTANNYTQLYVFGDSLSDTGRVYAASFGLVPAAPYNQGRFVNEQVWVEYLAQALNLPYEAANNYAWGGAKSGESHRQSLLIIPGILGQVDEYLANNTVNPNGLYMIFGGSNDLLDLQSVDTAAVSTVVENIITAATRLHEQGVQHLLILNSPDLSSLPSTPNPDVTGVVVQDFNTQLVTRIAALPFKAAYVDAFATTQAVRSDPDVYGFVNVDDVCYNQQTRTVCENPNTYVFWDEDHPTSAVHRVFATEVEAALQGHYFAEASMTLQLPAIEVAGGDGEKIWYRADLQYLSGVSPDTFEVTTLETVAPYTRLVEVATYTGVLTIPTVEVSGRRYQAELQLVPASNPLRFELSRLTALEEN